MARVADSRPTSGSPRLAALVGLLCAALVLAACGSSSPSPTPTLAPTVSEAPTPTVAPTPGVGDVQPAPGSTSEVYEPNPGAIVVAIDPGHGGCLDWGVPNPWDNTVSKAEKSDTLAIGLALRDLLVAQGITVVMTRSDDSALAGDDEPDLGCHGPPWRDVNGDGQAGFEETGKVRTRDELQARIDFANLARADLLLSIHINSLTQDGVTYEIAATETFYDDETPWGAGESAALAADVQSGVVTALDGMATYARQDRGTQAVAYFLISRQWADTDTCEVAGDTWCKPHRALQLPGILSEVGSISLEAESELLAGDAGRQTIAVGIYAGLVRYFADRPLAARYDLLVPGGTAGVAPAAVEGSGPPFWVPVLPALDAPVGLRLTNTGTQAWPAGLQLLAGWSPSELPYLAAPPPLSPLDVTVPALAPGESVVVELPLTAASGAGRQVGWFTLADGATPLTDLGSVALQVATQPGG